MARVGSPVVLASFCTYAYCRGYFVGCFWNSCRLSLTPGSCTFFNTLEALQSPEAFARHLAPLRKVDWGYTQSHRWRPSAGSSVFGALHASGGYSQSSFDRLRRWQGSLSLEGLPSRIATEGDEPGRRPSSSTVSYCMSCPADFSESDIMVFSPIAIARLSWHAAVNYSPPRSSNQTPRCLVRLSRPLRTTHRQIAA